MKSLTSSRNLAGGDENPKNLHSFGDRDGVSHDAKLQCPQAVHFIPEKNVVIVADTFNHKVKVLDPFRNEVFSWLGGSESTQTTLKDGITNAVAFNEPQSVSSLFDESRQDVKVYICDTNNHCIRVCHYDEGAVTTLALSGVPAAAVVEQRSPACGDISAKKRQAM